MNMRLTSSRSSITSLENAVTVVVSQMIRKQSLLQECGNLFFFVHAFMTGGMQNFVRKYKIPVDTFSFEHIMLDKDKYDEPP